MVSLNAHWPAAQIAEQPPVRSSFGSNGWRLARTWFCALPFLLVAFSLLLPALTAPGQSTALVDQWIAAQTNLHTWSAIAVQTRSLKTLTQPLVSTGQVWVVVPDRFRWELGQPAQTIAVRQPDQLSIIYPRLKRVEKYPLNGKQPGPWKDALALLEASFPRTRADLDSRFRVLSVTQTNSIVQVALQPKSAAARKFMAEIRVGYDSNTFTPTSTELRFSDGSTMRNDFSDSVLNQPIPAGLFEPKVGEGFTTVEPLGH